MTTVNLDQALKINLPPARRDLRPVSFETSDSRRGWMTSFTGVRPIATPAYDKGMLFVGGGYGSYEFVALDAASGSVAWKTTTAHSTMSSASPFRTAFMFCTPFMMFLSPPVSWFSSSFDYHSIYILEKLFNINMGQHMSPTTNFC